jgi:hypothetical protein
MLTHDRLLSVDAMNVAVIRDPSSPEVWREADWEKPYSEREHVTVEAYDDDTLGDVCDRAVAALGIELPTRASADRVTDVLPYTAFYRRADEYEPPTLQTGLTVVNSSGLAVWNVRWQEARLVDLFRAADAGVLGGDPRRPYLVLPHGFGDFWGHDWGEVLQALKVMHDQFHDAMAYLADEAAGMAIAWAALRRIVRRLRGIETLRDKVPSWRERGSAPKDFDGMLAAKAWDGKELASLLGCSPNEAEAVLWALGASFNDADSRWYLAHSDEDRFLHDNLLIAIWKQPVGDTDAIREIYRRRLDEFLRTFRPPPLPD